MHAPAQDYDGIVFELGGGSPIIPHPHTVAATARYRTVRYCSTNTVHGVTELLFVEACTCN
jgi:hypothetical protein